MASFKAAKKYDLNWVEFDTMPCLSGEWIVIHDASLERTTNGKGLVKNSTLTELKNLDAGSWFHKKFKHEKIPSLIEVLRYLSSAQIHPNIEIKVDQFSLEDIHNFTQLIHNHWPKNLPLPLFSSFNFDVLIHLRQVEAHWPISFLMEGFELNCIKRFKQNNFQYLSFQHELINVEQYRSLQRENIPIGLYTLNDAKQIQSWQSAGVNIFFTDRPDLVRPNLIQNPSCYKLKK